MESKNKTSSLMNAAKIFILVTWSLIFIYPSYWHIFVAPTIERYQNLYLTYADYHSISFPFYDIAHSYKFPIHNASIKGKIGKFQRILAANPNVNIKDWNGIYPLEYACCFNHAYLSKLLLDKGADPTLCTSYNPLNCTIQKKNYALLEALSISKANWNQKSEKEKYTPLQMAVKQKNIKAIQIALKYKARLTKKPIYEKHTPLEQAFIKQDKQAIEVALMNKLRQDVNRAHAKSILDQAIITKDLDVVAALVIGGAPLDGHIVPKSPLITSYLTLCKESGDPTQSLEFIKAQIKLSEQQNRTRWKNMPEMPVTTEVMYPEKPR